jgi:hypothetical protein
MISSLTDSRPYAEKILKLMCWHKKELNKLRIITSIALNLFNNPFREYNNTSENNAVNKISIIFLITPSRIRLPAFWLFIVVNVILYQLKKEGE